MQVGFAAPILAQLEASVVALEEAAGLHSST
jgi:hypothetical protein